MELGQALCWFVANASRAASLVVLLQVQQAHPLAVALECWVNFTYFDHIPRGACRVLVYSCR